MQAQLSKKSLILSIVTSILATIASAGGLLFKNLYSDNAFVKSVWLLVKGFTYGLVLCVSTIILAYSDTYGKWDPMMPMYIVLVAGGIVGCWLLLKNFEHKLKR